MSKKKILILTSIMLIILISVAGIYLKVKYEPEKENKKQYTIKNNKRALHFISSITLKNRIQSNLYISQTRKQVLWEVL